MSGASAPQRGSAAVEGGVNGVSPGRAPGFRDTGGLPAQGSYAEYAGYAEPDEDGVFRDDDVFGDDFGGHDSAPQPAPSASLVSERRGERDGAESGRQFSNPMHAARAVMERLDAIESAVVARDSPSSGGGLHRESSRFRDSSVDGVGSPWGASEVASSGPRGASSLSRGASRSRFVDLRGDTGGADFTENPLLSQRRSSNLWSPRDQGEGSAVSSRVASSPQHNPLFASGRGAALVRERGAVAGAGPSAATEDGAAAPSENAVMPLVTQLFQRAVAASAPKPTRGGDALYAQASPLAGLRVSRRAVAATPEADVSATLDDGGDAMAYDEPSPLNVPVEVATRVDDLPLGGAAAGPASAWIAKTSRTTGAPYFVHRESGDISVEPPSTEWVEKRSRSAGGALYWVNLVSGDATTERPAFVKKISRRSGGAYWVGRDGVADTRLE